MNEGKLEEMLVWVVCFYLKGWHCIKRKYKMMLMKRFWSNIVCYRPCSTIIKSNLTIISQYNIRHKVTDITKVPWLIIKIISVMPENTDDSGQVWRLRTAGAYFKQLLSTENRTGSKRANYGCPSFREQWLYPKIHVPFQSKHWYHTKLLAFVDVCCYQCKFDDYVC